MNEYTFCLHPETHQERLEKIMAPSSWEAWDLLEMSNHPNSISPFPKTPALLVAKKEKGKETKIYYKSGTGAWLYMF